MYGADELFLMLDQSEFSIRMRNTVWMGQTPGALPAGRQTSVTSTPLSTDVAPTRIVHAPLSLPFFLDRTLMPTNRPHCDCAFVLLAFPGLQSPDALAIVPLPGAP